MEFQGLTPRQRLAKNFKPRDATIYKSVEHIPETVTHASFVPQPLSKLVRCGAKHLEEGFPTIKGDPRTFNFTTHYKDIYKKHLHQRVEPVRKHYSTVILGDPAKGSEKKTLYGASYTDLNLSSFHKQPKKKDTNVLNPSDVFNVRWASTFKDDFRAHKVDLQGASSQVTGLQRATSSFHPKISFPTLDDIPKSMTHVSFIPHPPSKLVKPKVRHLEDGFPTIKGDLRAPNFLSQYRDAYRKHLVQPIELAEGHYSSVCMGNPAKGSETQTSYSSAFPQISVNSPTKPIYQDEWRPRYDYKDSWTTSFRDYFKPHRVEPIVLQQPQYVNSLPFVDASKEESGENIHLTINNIFFPSIGSQAPLCLPDPDLITKSNVYFGPESESKESCKPQKTEQNIQQVIDRPKAATYPKSNILTGPDLGPQISITMTDFKPKKITRQQECESQIKTNFKFPLGDMNFSTNYKDDYIVRPLFPPPTPYDQRNSNVKLR